MTAYEYSPGAGSKRDQVAEHMRGRIRSGDWKVNRAVPGLDKLKKDYPDTSWGVIRAAEQILINEGLLHQPQQGVPTYVKARPAAIGVPETLARVQEAHRALGAELQALAAALGDGGG